MQARTISLASLAQNKIQFWCFSITVDGIKIDNLNISSKLENKSVKKKRFKYSIKIADFYFRDTALLLIDRINNETNVKDVKIEKIMENKYRVYLSPFYNINTLQKSFNDINILEFENIEIIKWIKQIFS